MIGIAESHVEEATLAWLEELGYNVANGLTIGPDGSAPERVSYGDVILADRLKAAIARLNPHLNADTREEVFRKLTQSETPSHTRKPPPASVPHRRRPRRNRTGRQLYWR
jgi:type I restriction enzyme R subunit